MIPCRNEKIAQSPAPMHSNRSLPVLIISFIFIAFLAQNCSERTRSNPFDPQNPLTLGRPDPPEVISIIDSVRLQLPLYSHDDILSYNIYRKLAVESRFTKIAEAPIADAVFWDVGASFDVERLYRISISTDSYESPPSDSVQIRPGPTFVWALDAETGRVSKLSHDGRHEVLRTSLFIEPFAFTINARRQFGVIADFFSPQLFILNLRTGELGESILVGRRVTDIALNEFDNTIWVFKQDSSFIRKIDFAGRTQFEITDLQEPRDVALNPQTSSIWVAEKRAARIREFNRNGQNITTRTGFANIQSLAVFEQNGAVWVADSNAVHIFEPDGAAELTTISGFGLAEKLAVDQASGACWVIDSGGDFRNSELIKISKNGDIEFSVAGLDAPRDLAVNNFNGYCFVAEAGARKLAQFNNFGEQISGLTARGAFVKVVIEDRSRLR